MKQNKFKVMAIQMSSVIGDKEKNIQKVKYLIDKNIKEETDIIVLPEVWTVGWACNYFQKSAEDVKTGEAMQFLSSIAKSYNVNIIGGSLILKRNAKLYNACPVFDKNGNLIAEYDKCHLFSYYGDNEGEYITNGKNPVIVNLGGIRVGLSICYDIRFPELYRAYAVNGVDMMVNVAAWGIKKEIPWVSMTHSRAVENQTYFVALTQSGELPNGDYNLGKSAIIDYKGDNLAEINSGEGAIFAELDFNLQQDFREKCTVLKDIHEAYNVEVK